jgi:hypothetical protein
LYDLDRHIDGIRACGQATRGMGPGPGVAAMSDTDNTPATPAVPLPAEIPPRRIWLTRLMILGGTVLLLPGLCSVGAGAYAFYLGGFMRGLSLLVQFSCPFVTGLLVAGGGIMSLRAAIHGPVVEPAGIVAGKPPRNIYLTMLMVLVGIVLLVPGLCSVAVVGGVSYYDPAEAYSAASLYGCYVVLGLLVAFGGIMLLRAAIRGRRH